MIRLTLTICLATSLFFSCNNGDDNSKTVTETDTVDLVTKNVEPPNPPPPVLDSATIDKNWKAYMAPGKEHEMMAKWNGNWTTEMTSWMSPDAPPSKSTGTVKNRMGLGGRYQLSDFKGNMMGMPFEGMSITGYDNHKKVFVTSWIDNMGTGIMNLQGPWDEATKSMTLKGKMVDPGSGYEVQIKEIFTIIDDNTQKLEFFSIGSDGKEVKSMEGIFKRKN